MDMDNLPDAAGVGAGPARFADKEQEELNESARLGEQFDEAFGELPEPASPEKPGKQNISVVVDGRQTHLTLGAPGEEPVQVTFFCGLDPKRAAALAYTYAGFLDGANVESLLKRVEALAGRTTHASLPAGLQDEYSLRGLLSDPDADEVPIYPSCMASDPKPFGEEPIDRVRTQAMADAMLWAQSRDDVKPDEIVEAAREFATFYQFGER